VGRLEILAGLLAIGGAVLFVRSVGHVLRALRAKFTYGAPYRYGALSDRLLGLAMTVPVLLAGLVLGWLAVAQAAFQPDGVTVRVGQIETRRTEWGKTAIRVVPDPDYPAHRLLEGEVSGARWAIAGDFIVWSRDVTWLGLRNGHRLRYLMSSTDTSGLTPETKTGRTVLDPLPAAASCLLALDRYLPFLSVTVQSSPWYPTGQHQVLILYATGAGYLSDRVSSVGRLPGSLPERRAALLTGARAGG
jgi:hypothetical protein